MTRARKRSDAFSYILVNVIASIYLFMALRLIKKYQNNLLKDLLNKPKSFSKRELIKIHNRNKSTLDTTDLTRIHNLKKSWYQSSLITMLSKVVSITKEVEMHSRILLYPERNEVVLTYDELRELISLTSEFECASEQSNSYSSN
jgi:hypothetical protein